MSHSSMTAAVAMTMVGNVPGGAYLLGRDVLGRSGCGEMKSVMYSKDQVTEKGGWPDA